jgi:hypothetical protein
MRFIGRNPARAEGTSLPFTVLLRGEFGVYLPASNAGLHLLLLAVYGPAYYSASKQLIIAGLL